MVTRGKYMLMEEPPQKMGEAKVILGDCQEILDLNSIRDVDSWVFSPPYFRKKRYTNDPQEIGVEERLGDYLYSMGSLAKKMLKVSRATSTLFMVVADSRNGSGGTGGDYQDEEGKYVITTIKGASEDDISPTSPLSVPWKLIEYFTAEGWMLVNVVIWNKNDARRAGKRRVSDSYEVVLVFGASEDYYFNKEAVLQEYSEKSLSQLSDSYHGVGQMDYSAMGVEDPSETKRRMMEKMKDRPGAYLRDVWEIPSGFMPRMKIGKKMEKAQASFPLVIPEICVLLGSKKGDLVVDPFCGWGNTLIAATTWGRDTIGIDLDPISIKATKARLKELGV